jgi:hypothetical protein
MKYCFVIMISVLMMLPLVSCKKSNEGMADESLSGVYCNQDKYKAQMIITGKVLAYMPFEKFPGTLTWNDKVEGYTMEAFGICTKIQYTKNNFIVYTCDCEYADCKLKDTYTKCE